jgi:hypothetical protein
MNLKQLERLIESLEEFKSFQQALREERDARKAYQKLAAVEATRPAESTQLAEPPRLIDDLLLDRRRLSPGRLVAPPLGPIDDLLPDRRRVSRRRLVAPRA